MEALLILLILIGLILFGFLTKRDIGYLTLFAAMICGLLLADLDLGQIIGFIPLNTIASIILITAFFGYAVENGTMQGLIDRLLLPLSRRSAWFPLAMFLISAVAAGAGLGAGNATMLLTPIAFLIGTKAGQNPLTLGLSVSCGTTIGSNLPFSYGGVIFSSLVSDLDYAGSASALTAKAAALCAIVFSVSFLAVLLFFAKRGATVQNCMPEPVPFQPKQKKTLVLIVCIVLVVVIPNVIYLLSPTRFWGAVTRFCDLRVAMTAGIVLASFMRLSDDLTILQKHVPWKLIILISGISMLIGVADAMGITAILANGMTSRIPDWVLLYAVTVVSMIMSLFASAIAVVIPTLLPMVSVLAAASGQSPEMLYIGVFLGASCGGISPMSTGGMIVLANSSLRGRERGKLFYQLLLMPFLQTAVCCLVLYLSSIL